MRKWKSGRVTLYDYGDLAFFDGCIHRGEPIPATPEERDQLRVQRRTAALTTAA